MKLSTALHRGRILAAVSSYRVKCSQPVSRWAMASSIADIVPCRWSSCSLVKGKCLKHGTVTFMRVKNDDDDLSWIYECAVCRAQDMEKELRVQEDMVTDLHKEVKEHRQAKKASVE